MTRLCITQSHWFFYCLHKKDFDNHNLNNIPSIVCTTSRITSDSSMFIWLCYKFICKNEKNRYYYTILGFGSQNVIWTESSEPYCDAEEIEQLRSHPIYPGDISDDSYLTAVWIRCKLV